MEPLISVVVPVFQTKKYLTRCVESLLAQTYANLEIILIDDGSTDGSGCLCDEFSLLDARIKVVHQENGGVSRARNCGLRLATGDYVGFVDSDDYVDVNMYETMIRAALNYQVDIIQCGRASVLSCDVGNVSYHCGEVCCIEKHQALKELMCSRVVRSSACDKLYRRALTNGITFDESLSVGEDFLFNYHLIDKADKVAVLERVTYFYRQREGSTSRGIIHQKDFHIFDSLSEMERCEQDHDLARYWKLRKAMFAVNFLRRMVPENDYSRFAEFREYIADAKFLLLNPKKYQVSNDKNFALHVLFAWLAPKLYIQLLEGNKS